MDNYFIHDVFKELNSLNDNYNKEEQDNICASNIINESYDLNEGVLSNWLNRNKYSEIDKCVNIYLDYKSSINKINTEIKNKKIKLKNEEPDNYITKVDELDLKKDNDLEQAEKDKNKTIEAYSNTFSIKLESLKDDTQAKYLFSQWTRRIYDKYKKLIYKDRLVAEEIYKSIYNSLQEKLKEFINSYSNKYVNNNNTTDNDYQEVQKYVEKFKSSINALNEKEEAEKLLVKWIKNLEIKYDTTIYKSHPIYVALYKVITDKFNSNNTNNTNKSSKSAESTSNELNDKNELIEEFKKLPIFSNDAKLLKSIIDYVENNKSKIDKDNFTENIYHNFKVNYINNNYNKLLFILCSKLYFYRNKIDTFYSKQQNTNLNFADKLIEFLTELNKEENKKKSTLKQEKEKIKNPITIPEGQDKNEVFNQEALEE